MCTEISLQWLMETLKTLSCNCTVLEESSLVVSFWKLDSNLPYTLIWEWWSLIPNLWWAPHWVSQLLAHSHWWVLAHTYIVLLPCFLCSCLSILSVHQSFKITRSHPHPTHNKHWREEALNWSESQQDSEALCQLSMTRAGLSCFFCKAAGEHHRPAKPQSFQRVSHSTAPYKIRLQSESKE